MTSESDKKFLPYWNAFMVCYFLAVFFGLLNEPSRTLPPPDDPNFHLHPLGQSLPFPGFSITHQTPSTAPYTFPMNKFWRCQFLSGDDRYHLLHKLFDDSTLVVDHEGRLSTTNKAAFFLWLDSILIPFEQNYPGFSQVLCLSIAVLGIFFHLWQLISNWLLECPKSYADQVDDCKKRQDIQSHRDLLEHCRHVDLKQKLGSSRYIFFYGKPEKCSFL